MEAIIDLPVANLKYERQTKNKLTAQRHAPKVMRMVMCDLKRLGNSRILRVSAKYTDTPCMS
jgi:hypothetical protein